MDVTRAPATAALSRPLGAPAPDKKLQAALRKLHIDGKEALKGDTEALEKQKRERERAPVYRWRGAAYEVEDGVTKREWLERQPGRWKKIGRHTRSPGDKTQRRTADNSDGSYRSSDELSTDDGRPWKRRRFSHPALGQLDGADEREPSAIKQRKRASLPSQITSCLTEEEKLEKRRLQTKNARLARSEHAARRRAEKEAQKIAEATVKKAKAKADAVPMQPLAPSPLPSKRKSNAKHPARQRTQLQTNEQELGRQSSDREDGITDGIQYSIAKNRRDARHRGLETVAFTEDEISAVLARKVGRLARLNASKIFLQRKLDEATKSCNRLRYDRLQTGDEQELYVEESQGHSQSGQTTFAQPHLQAREPDSTVDGGITQQKGDDNVSCGLLSSQMDESESQLEDLGSETPQAQLQHEASIAESEFNHHTKGRGQRSSQGEYATGSGVRQEPTPETSSADGETEPRQKLVGNSGCSCEPSQNWDGRDSRDAGQDSVAGDKHSGVCDSNSPPPINRSQSVSSTIVVRAGPSQIHLPQVNKNGDPLGWTIRRVGFVEGTAQYEMNKARQAGESQTTWRRRVKRELALMSGW